MPQKWLLFGIVVGLPWSALAAETPFKEPNCTSTQEFVGTLEYLRDQKEFKIPEFEARKIALKVASGCSGAGRRFIRITQLLMKSDMSAKDSVQLGIELAHRTDGVADTFAVVFKQGYLGEYLDLSLPDAVRLAKSLSTEFEGDMLSVRDDFERLVDFCVNSSGLDLPKPQCGALSARVARKGQWFSGGAAENFKKDVAFIFKRPDFLTFRRLFFSPFQG